MLRCKNTFWLNNITDLFCDFRIIPFKGMNLDEQLNSVTRLVFFVFIILLLFLDIQSCMLFLALSLLTIIIFYYIKRPMSKDNFVMPPYLAKAYSKTENLNGQENIIINRPSNYTWYNDEVPFEFNNPEYISINQKLVGAANPKTNIPPVIVPPVAELEYWKTNNLVTNSLINDQKQIDISQSGYVLSSCKYADDTNMYIDDKTPKLYTNVKRPRAPTCTGSKYSKNKINLSEYTEMKETFENQRFKDHKVRAQKSMPPGTFPVPYEIKPKPLESGQLDINLGYNPEQLYESALPSNYPSGKCQRDPALKSYNKNLFTQNIEPGVTTYSEIIEPINSNIGISFDQQFEPLTAYVDEPTDTLNYVQHDPRIFTEEPEYQEETVNAANVYDPRFTGYGTSYRAYSDNRLGQTKYYYDDIDSIRMPNYIVRSKIDFMEGADIYGAMPSDDGNPYTNVIRNLANDKFDASAIQFRTGLQERLMRKMNAGKWQQRQAPINRTSTFMNKIK